MITNGSSKVITGGTTKVTYGGHLVKEDQGHIKVVEGGVMPISAKTFHSAGSTSTSSTTVS